MSGMRRLYILALVPWGVAACGGAKSATQAAASGLSPLSMARASTDAGLSADGNVLAGDLRAGALALYRAAAGGDNFVLSPLALQLALGMTYLGCRGETAAELAAGMRWSQAPEVFGAAQQNLLEVLGGGALAVVTDPPTVLETATRVFATTEFPILPAFAAALSGHYQAPVAGLDFRHDPEGSRARVNAWVGEQTGGKIGDLLPAGSVDADTAMVLTAALRFRAHWPAPLARDRGTPLAFTTAAGQTRQLGGLRTTETLPYRATASETSVRLLYAGGAFTMLLVLPRGDVGTYARGLTAAAWEALLTDAGASPVPVALTLPAFDVASATGDLAAPLATLGITRLFEATGELVVLDPAGQPPPQYVSHVYESAHLSLDDQGTEAEAAAAVVVGETTAAPLPPPAAPVPVILDRPFLFFLQDARTQTVIFAGHVGDPAAG